MKKKIISLIGVSLAAIVLASCGKNQNKSDDNNEDAINDSYKLKIVCPNGAPIIGIAEAASYYKNNVNDENIGVQPSTLSGFFNAGDADIIIAPVNLGTKLYNEETSLYQIAGILTWGNTYFASGNTTFTINDINGSNITMFGQNSITEKTANYVLTQKGITPSNKEFLGSAKLTADYLRNNQNSIVMTAEPELAAIKAANSNIKAFSVNDLYKEITSFDMPQAAVFVDPDVVKDHKELLNAFLKKIDDTDSLCESNPRDVAVKSISLGYGNEGEENIIAAGIPTSKVNYKKASDSKSELNKMIELFAPLFGSKTPNDEFYYQ